VRGLCPSADAVCLLSQPVPVKPQPAEPSQPCDANKPLSKGQKKARRAWEKKQETKVASTLPTPFGAQHLANLLEKAELQPSSESAVLATIMQLHSIYIDSFLCRKH
jgi:hypothetical protein